MQSSSRRKGNWNYERLLKLFREHRDNCKAHPDEKGIETQYRWSGRALKCCGLQSSSRRKGNWNIKCRPVRFAATADCKAHPDEKGIETQSRLPEEMHKALIAKLIPTKRELKLMPSPANLSVYCMCIAKLIPTKRELKRLIDFYISHYFFLLLQSSSRRKGNWNWRAEASARAGPCSDCKAHPDEKGIETKSLKGEIQAELDCKAHPDEKGIETAKSAFTESRAALLQSSSRRKGNWNRVSSVRARSYHWILQSSSRRKGNWNRSSSHFAP